MKYKDEMEVLFWHGTNREGVAATHKSTLRIANISREHELVHIEIEHVREDICDPITGYGVDTFIAFAELGESELDTLIGMLETCKSKLKEFGAGE